MSSTKTPESRQRPLDEAHKAAMICAARLVSKCVETRDKQVRGPLIAMNRRLFEAVLGIRKRIADLPQDFGAVHEQILEAEKGSKLDEAAQQMLGKICVGEPIKLKLPERLPVVSNTTYLLPEYFRGLQIERLEEPEEPNAHYILHNIDASESDHL